MEKLKNISTVILILSIAIYFCLCSLGRLKLDEEQTEATRLHIELLKLQLYDIKPNVKDEERT